MVAIVYFSSATLGGSAYLAAFVMGLIVGNMNEFKLRQHEESSPGGRASTPALLLPVPAAPTLKASGHEELYPRP